MVSLPATNWDDVLRWMILSGIAILVASYLWLLVEAFRTRWTWGVSCLLFPPLLFIFAVRFAPRTWKPSLIMALGVCLAAFPPLYTRFAPVDLGPRERIVEGERHLTLTGWDRKDYNLLGSKADVVVLQMANRDVSDETLARLSGFANLRELDLSDSSVTDAGLLVLRDLPRLETLRLARTRITDPGFSRALQDKESLRMLDLSGTGVTRETVNAWKGLKPKRKALL